MSILNPEPCPASGAGRDVESLILCDVAEGLVVGAALAVYEYDSVTGAPIGPPTFVDPITGAPYVPIGTLQPCPGGSGGGECPCSLTNAELRASPVPISGEVALDLATLAALENVKVENVGGTHLASEIHDPTTGHIAEVTSGKRLKVESAAIGDTLTTGAITAGSGANSYVVVPASALNQGQSSFTVDLHPGGPGWTAGTTVVIEGTLDDIDWVQVYVFDLTAASAHTASFVGPGPFTARGICGGFLKLRARASAYSGSDRVNVNFRTTVADTAVAVVNAQTDALTDLELRASPVTIDGTVDAAEKNALLSYAKFRTADDTISPAVVGNRLQIVWALVVANPDNVLANGVTIRMTIGGTLTDVYAVYALGRSAVFTGDANTDIVIDLDNAQPVSVNIQYREIT